MSSEFLMAFVAAILALVAAGLAGLAWQAARGAPQRLGLTLDKLLANERAEAETTRAFLAAAEGRLTAAIQAGTTEALSRAFSQISAATQNVASTVDGLRRQAAEDAQKTLALLESRLTTIQSSVNEKLHDAVEQQMTVSFARVLEQFAQVQQAMGEVQSAAAQIGDLKRLFSNVKTRGGWGEAQLGAMLEQILPPGAFERNFAVKDGARERVDFALRMPAREKLWLPVDAKFPTEDYERLLAAADAADNEAERSARDGLAVRARLEAKKIREKYISPPETVDFGVMYLPSDGLFAEVARIPGLIDDVRSREKVIILGPTLLPAMLQTIHLGHVTLDLEKRAGEIGKLLGATRGEMVKMDDVLAKLAANASAMSNNIEKARVRTRAVSRVLRNVEMVDGAPAQVLLGLENEEE
ncbi:DNA recombination protein RmuC [Acidocella aromatica]|uniref:DNA recombination protein RmuC homolog n=1 Tax=Acidocella aromatica TaxID=1303579 RepID=A0A840VDX5_9PROT|nr:DNA recombination protein RmuC [Acidocella aromatica]MBB5373906.1 DNA recombination protein RmuC [Acidocella aromatica]